MAILKNVSLHTGLEVEGAYHRVGQITLLKYNMRFCLRKYVSEEKPFFSEEIHTCSYDIEGQNPFQQAYEYLKTLEEFKDSEDC